MPNGRPWPSPGPLFPDTFPDERTPEQLVEDLRRVRGQVANLGSQAQDKSVRRYLLARLQDRIQEREEPLQVDLIPSGRGYELMVVADELLVRSDQLDDAVLSFFRDLNLEYEPVETLRGRIGRLRNPRLGIQRLSDIAQFLRQQGVDASVHHVTPLGQRVPDPVGKKGAGPEPTDAQLPFSPRDRNPFQVAVVDTGICPVQLRTDQWLQVQDIPRDADNVDPIYEPLPEPPPPPADRRFAFGAAHGTAVTGTLQRVEPGAFIRVYRALNRDGIGDEVGVAAAMVRAVEDGARILNLSLGTETVGDRPPLAMEVALELIEEIEQDRGEEVAIVAAAGNFGSSRPCWPAAFRRVVSVASVAPDGQPSSWSNNGFWVTCSAIGEGVVAPFVPGTESWELDPQPDRFNEPNPQALCSGTSFAAPQVAGAIARICKDDGATPRVALGELLRRGTPLADYGRVLEILPGT
jgi:Subtilase family